MACALRPVLALECKTNARGLYASPLATPGGILICNFIVWRGLRKLLLIFQIDKLSYK